MQEGKLISHPELIAKVLLNLCHSFRWIVSIEIEEVVMIRRVKSVNLVKDNSEHCKGVKLHVDLLKLIS